MSKIWFTSDTHFGSDRVFKFSKRPFQSVKEMDSEIIKRWNEVVGKDDIVYHLGDFGEYHNVKKLNGNIRLILGNYETKEMEDGLYSMVSFCEYLTYVFGFDAILENFQIRYNNFLFHLCHKPLDRLFNPNIFNLFGHVHKLQMVKRNGLNVGTDCHNFYPIDLETVLFYKESIEEVYDENVFGE